MGFFDGGAGLFGAVTNLVGGIMSNNAQTAQAAEANRFSAEQNSAQMAFQERMRANQYQTAVEDMKKAGLNPMLTASQGGAGNLTGASAVGQQANIRNPTEGMANSASTMANIKAGLEKTEAETVESVSRTGLNDEQRKLTDAQTNLAILEAPNVSQKLKNLVSEQLLNNARENATAAEAAARRLDIQIRSSGDLPEAQSKGRYYKDSPYNPFTLKDVIQGGHSAADIARAINPLKIGK